MKKILLTACFFGLLFLQLHAQGTASGDFSTQKIAETFAALDQENKYAEQMIQSELNVLPMGMRKTINNNEFAIAVSSARFYSTYAELTMFARMKIGQRPNDPLYFAATGVKFSYDGGFTGDASLVLIGDVDIPINEHTILKLRGGSLDASTGTVASGKKTSLTVDCSGFKELEVEASLIFSQSFIQKVSTDGNVLPDPVSADFSIVVNDWNNLFVQINLPAFQIKGLDGFIFTLSDITFDFSDYQNPEASFFPAGYAGRYMVSGSPDLWRGVCAKALKVTLPKDFSKDGQPASFAAQNLIMDDNGISGSFTGENILPVDVGNASGWAFSIDKFFLEMEAHKIKSGGFSGIIGLPVGDNVQLNYNAQIMGNNSYQLAVALRDTLPFDMLAGKAILFPNSSVTIQMDNGKFKPEANLTGLLTLQTLLDASSTGKVEMKGIAFQGLKLRTEAPYASVDYMGYKDEIKLFNLPVSISDIRLTTASDQLNLGFNLKLNLDDNFLSASSDMNFSSKYVTTNGRGQWKFQGVNIGAVSLNSEIAGVLALTGSLQIMTGDPDYGDGFAGDIDLKFKSIIQGCSVNVAAAFGSKNGSRYWFVDGAVTLPVTIPIVGPLGINGFAGGASMGMKRVLNAGLNRSKTGCGFLPDETIGLGLKAGVTFKTIQSNIVNGNASFEILFNKSGGINTVGFYGYAEFAASIKGMPDVSSVFKGLVDKEIAYTGGKSALVDGLNKLKMESPTEAAKVSTDAESQVTALSIGAALGILYNIPDKTLHANFDFYVNGAGGMIRGIGANNRAGWAVLHISPQKWYIYLGTPTDPIGLKIGVPGIATLETKSYFMLGDDIPGSPAPPKKVTDYLSTNGETYDYMRELNTLQSGMGIAFGASLSFSTGDLTFLILYAKLEAELGFDVMIKDYKDAQCRGRSGAIGINGWYANGQIYAYLAGEVGVKVNLAFIKGRFPIISAGCATLLQAKLPNPTWFGGSMGVHFNILGGLVKGNMRFKFNFGDECEILQPGTSPLEVSMINDLSPASNATDVDVFTAPQVALSNPANTSFVVSDESGKKTYRISLDRFTVKDGSVVIPGEIRWNKDMTTATFYSHDVLPPKKKLDLEVGVGFEEFSNGKWQVVTTSGQKAVETRNISFTTGEAPDYIPLSNIVYTYPLINQKYYYVKESTSGYVQLDRGQSYLFPTTGWTYSVNIDRTGKSETNSYSYDADNKRIYYTLRSALNRGQEYDIKFQAIPVAKTTTSTPQTKETVLLKDEENEVIQSGTAANQVIQESSGKEILIYHFSASTYETFADKISKVKKGQTTTEIEGTNIVGLGCLYSGLSEGFSDEEIFGTAATQNKPMIQATVVPTVYYNNYIFPKIYSGYPPSGLRLTRTGDAVGIPPIYAFGKWMESGKFPIRYEATKYYLHDYIELRNMVVNAGLRSHPLYNDPSFPDILSGKYPALLQYILPGGENGSSSPTFEYEIYKQ
jgi:hypothetical protein